MPTPPRPPSVHGMTTLEDQAELNPAAVEAFGDRMLGIANEACTALMMSIGHQTGLFATLAGRPASTSAAVAAAAGLDERYVREWLNAMTTARVVVHDPVAATYLLPGEHATWLTDDAGPDNLARLMVMIPMIAEVEQGIVRCFREGGGLSYDDYDRFHELMAADSSAVVDATLLDVVVPAVDGLADRLREGIDVADIGCGSGHLVNVLARAFPNSRLVGYDFSPEAIAAARAEARALGLTNARFEELDVATLDEVAAYDLVTAFDAIHDQAHPAQVLDAISRAVRDDGTFLMVDIGASSHVHENLEHPFGTFLYTVSTMHCMTVSLGLGGDGLGTAWGQQLATAMLNDAGFTTIEMADVEADPANVYYVCRK
jgi:SAM-dependent methyltransferase